MTVTVQAFRPGSAKAALTLDTAILVAIAMSALRLRVNAGDDAGMSLVEVIIYSALTALVLSVLGGLFYAGFQTQAAASGRDAATGAAQVVSNSLQTGVRQRQQHLGVRHAAQGAGRHRCRRLAMRDLGTDRGQTSWCTRPPRRRSPPPTYSTWTVLAAGASGRLAGGSAFSGGSAQVSYSLAFTSGSVTVPVAGAVNANAFGTGSPESCW